jgi:hypothetical protein
MSGTLVLLPFIIIGAIIAAVIGAGVIVAVVCGINRITAAIPFVGAVVGDATFRKYYPFVFGALFVILSGVFLGSVLDTLAIRGQGFTPYRHHREVFNEFVMIAAPIAFIVKLGVFIGVSKVEQKEHIVLPTMTLATLGMVFFGSAWFFMISTLYEQMMIMGVHL